MFTDGKSVYSELAKQYITHDKGLFILAPSGSGKTYFVNHQSAVEKHWIDGDLLWIATNADPTGDEWDDDPVLVQEINDRCDIITYQAKKLGFWIMGSSNSSLRPDAIVLPPWEKHIQMIRKREQCDYDGGAKEEDLNGVKAHRGWIARWEAKGVPQFSSIDDAVGALAPKSQFN
jgi:hypothetical protein